MSEVELWFRLGEKLIATRWAAFVFVDRNTRQTRTILGYPTHQLEHAGQG